jgi:hypothetical protein
MSKKKNYLTENEVEDLKAACASEERSVIRDLNDTDIRLEEFLKKEQVARY